MSDKRHPPCATCGTPSQFDLCDRCYEKRAEYIRELLRDDRKNRQHLSINHTKRGQ